MSDKMGKPMSLMAKNKYPNDIFQNYLKTTYNISTEMKMIILIIPPQYSPIKNQQNLSSRCKFCDLNFKFLNSMMERLLKSNNKLSSTLQKCAQATIIKAFTC